MLKWSKEEKTMCRKAIISNFDDSIMRHIWEKTEHTIIYYKKVGIMKMNFQNFYKFRGYRRIEPTQNCTHEIRNVFMMLILG